MVTKDIVLGNKISIAGLEVDQAKVAVIKTLMPHTTIKGIKTLTCQQVKAKHQKPAGLLQPLEVVEWKWEHVTMDFVTHLPRTPQGHDAVWGDNGPAHEVGTFCSCANDLHIGEILPVVHSRDSPATWSTSIYSVG